MIGANIDIEQAADNDPDCAFLLVYRDEGDERALRSSNVWRVSAYSTEDDLIADLIENNGQAFAAIHAPLRLLVEVKQ